MTGSISRQQDTFFPSSPRVRLLLITGLSGAGRTLSLKALEDVGYEAIDNLPLSLIGRLLSPLTQPGEGDHEIAIAVDVRQKDFSPESFNKATIPLTGRDDIELTIVFLDCDNEVLVRRFTETRRRHPLSEDRPIMDGIMLERQLLAPLKEKVLLGP